MKILHLIASFGSGGAERQLSLLAPAMVEAGLEVHVAYCVGGPNLKFLVQSGVHLHVLPSKGNYDPALALEIYRLIRKLRPDIVQTWLLQMDVLGGIAALLNSVPFITSERASAAAYSTGWKNRLRILLGQRAACVIANSNGGLDYWRQYIPDERLHLVRNCVSPMSVELMDPLLEKTLPNIAERQIVLFAGRFSYEKNIPILVDALILVAKQQPKIIILLFGEGPERELAERKIGDAGLGDRMVLAGYSSNLAYWMQRASVCVSVSHFEGHPNVVIEAAAAGCPLVLSDISAHRELFGDESVAFVPADSPSSIAVAVVRALHNPLEARLRADQARATASQWNISVATKGFCSIYKKIVNTAQSKI